MARVRASSTSAPQSRHLYRPAAGSTRSSQGFASSPGGLVSRAPTPARKQPFCSKLFSSRRSAKTGRRLANNHTNRRQFAHSSKRQNLRGLVPLGYSSLLITSLLPFASPPHHPSPPPSTTLFFLAHCRVGESPSPAPFGRRCGTCLVVPLLSSKC